MFLLLIYYLKKKTTKKNILFKLDLNRICVTIKISKKYVVDSTDKPKLPENNQQIVSSSKLCTEYKIPCNKPYH